MDAVAYLLNALATCLFVLALGVLLIGLNAAVTVALHRRGVIDDDRADRLFRIRALSLTLLGLLCLLIPVQPVVTGRGLSAVLAGVLLAGVLMTGGGIVAHSWFSQRIERRGR